MATTEERIRDGLEDNLVELAKSLHTSAFQNGIESQLAIDADEKDVTKAIEAAAHKFAISMDRLLALHERLTGRSPT